MAEYDKSRNLFKNAGPSIVFSSMFTGYRLEIGLPGIAVILQLSAGQYIVGYLQAYIAESFQTVGFFIEISGVAVNGSVAVMEDDIALEAIYSGIFGPFVGIVVGLLKVDFDLSHGGGGYQHYKQDNR
nr:hypothetical protein [Parachryseolinea silvisoli]